ncbi:carnitine/acyl carnitine carrier [Panus rudis PR-1116 ss-1]|nr:carnitine/acyl carnitine carrier [Panus rudis PR-1116 ss-1]
MSQGISPILDFTAGTIAGSAALIVGFPFDTVKVRLQNPSVGVQYRSTFHGVTTIIRQEGFRSLFRGISSPLVTAAPLNGLVFSSYKFFMRAQLDSEDSIPSLTQVTLAGAATGVVGSILTTPTELIKIQQQSQQSLRGSDKPPTFIDVARRILRQHGIRGLYRGITSTALRDTGYGAYFAAYEATLLYFPTRPAEPYDHTSLLSEADSTIASHSLFTLLLAGGLAGIAGWIVTFPFDVVKTRIQASHDYSRTNPYRNTWSAIIHSHRQDGLSVFFRGLAPTLIRAIPVNMVTFATFEAIVHAFS